LALVGVRYFKPEHRIIIDDKNIKLYEVDEVRKAGGNAIADAIHNYLSACDRIFISFDVDSLDCDEVSRGTGTPEPAGLYLQEAIDLVCSLMKNPRVIGLEIAEVNPLLDDKGNSMAEAAWELLKHSIVNTDTA
jgi:arginase